MARFFLILFGLVLLFPGLCSLGLLAIVLPDIGTTSARDIESMAAVVILPLLVFGLLGWGGVALIRKGIRGDHGEPPAPGAHPPGGPPPG